MEEENLEKIAQFATEDFSAWESQWNKAIVGYIVDDLNHVLEGGPWYMESRPFIIKKWTPEVRLEQDRL
ncbi:hypothetical protein QJS10_CPB15g00773 [Acorus calamus]|uniref:DUF4283 domain-containing protein n=1 Tax=Acorus calamus TaxID=4465 RepID=A0AAV9D496_ACOCL|nr:hypothetical protein QJS10_CPB15g00773 [Acorus calamus]